jgi:hypothetical protein
MMKMRESSLISAYECELKVEKEKEWQLERVVGDLKRELASLIEGGGWAERVKQLEARIEVHS